MHAYVSPTAETPSAAPPALDVNSHALFLDLDGTLVDIAETPAAAAASAELIEALGALAARMNGALALITGRTIAGADHVLQRAVSTIAGIHGLERRHRGVVHQAPQTRAMARARNAVQLARLPIHLEDKGASLALHFRHAPEQASRVQAAAREIASAHGLRVLLGKMVVELLDGAHTKGDAVRAFMDEAPFAGRTPIAAGDDVTDEHAFAAVNAAGGYAILVGETRPSAARYRLDGPAAVLAWLRAAIEAQT